MVTTMEKLSRSHLLLLDVSWKNLDIFFVEEPSRPCTRADRKDAKAEKEQTDWNK